MKVLLLAPFLNTHGPLPKHTPVLIEALEANDVDVSYFFWGKHNDDETIIEKMVGRFIDANDIKRKINNLYFDVIVLKTGHNWSSLLRDIFLLSLINKFSKKIIIEFHGSQSNKLVQKRGVLFKTFSHWLLSYADSIIVLSSEEQVQWKCFSPKLPCYTTANPFTPPNISLTNIKRKEDEILFVGRLIKEKGVLETIEAFQLVLSKKECHLSIAGEGKLKGKIEKIIKEKNLRENVAFLGYLEEEELYQIYQSATMLVLPTYFYEGFPTVITEAMYMGLPIITTPIRGTRDYLINEKNALFISEKNCRALADAILKMLNNRSLREKMAKENKQLITSFKPTKVGKGFLEILKNTLSQ